MLIRALAAGALACALAGCARHDASTGGGAPSAAYQTELRAEQRRLAALDRTHTAQRRAVIARVVTGSARDVTPDGSMVERFIVTVTNHAHRPIRGIGGGVIVYSGAERLGLSTFTVPVDVEPGKTARVPVAIPLTAFATEGAGALAQASGKPKRVELDLTSYSFDGATGADAD
jgi:hypothetical protein